MHNTFIFKLWGRKYVISTDDGYVDGVRLPDGTHVMNIPPELAACPRFQRMLAREQEIVRGTRALLDELGPPSYGGWGD